MFTRVYDAQKGNVPYNGHDRYTVVFIFPKKAQKINNARGMYITCCPSKYDDTIYVCEQNYIPFGERINGETLFFGKRVKIESLPSFFQKWINDKIEVTTNWEELK